METYPPHHEIQNGATLINLIWHIRDTFALFDKDRDGEISSQELAKVEFTSVLYKDEDQDKKDKDKDKEKDKVTRLSTKTTGDADAWFRWQPCRGVPLDKVRCPT